MKPARTIEEARALSLTYGAHEPTIHLVRRAHAGEAFLDALLANLVDGSTFEKVRSSFPDYDPERISQGIDELARSGHVILTRFSNRRSRHDNVPADDFFNIITALADAPSGLVTASILDAERYSLELVIDSRALYCCSTRGDIVVHGEDGFLAFAQRAREHGTVARVNYAEIPLVDFKSNVSRTYQSLQYLALEGSRRHDETRRFDRARLDGEASQT